MFKIFKPQSGLALIIIVLLVIGAFLLGAVVNINLHLSEPVRKGRCVFDTFKGKCKITSIFFYEQTYRWYGCMVGYRFTPTESLSKEAKHFNLNKDIKRYPEWLGLECLKGKEGHVTKEDLEKCNIKENAVFDCEMKVLVKGTCTTITPTPIYFNFIDNSE